MWGSRGGGRRGGRGGSRDTNQDRNGDPSGPDALASLKRHADSFRAKMDGFLNARIDADAASGISGAAPSFRSSGWVNVIVRGTGGWTPEAEAELDAFGAKRIARLDSIESLAIKVPAGSLARLAGRPDIETLSEDAQVVKFDEFTVGSSLADVAAERHELTGDGIGVAVVDSGIGDHKDLGIRKSNRVEAAVSFVPGDLSTDDACGHGTHVAGVLAGNGASSRGRRFTRTFMGIAPKADLINVRVLDAQGRGSVSSVIQGIEWVVKHRNKLNIRVLNLSLGHPIAESYETDPLCRAVEKAWKAGIVVICAAGNSGRLNANPTPGMDNGGYGAANGSIQSPANSPYAITVGAMKQTQTSANRDSDTIATYSARGPSRIDFILKPDLVAPGNRIISLRKPGSYLENLYGTQNIVPLNEYVSEKGLEHENESAYFRLSGTSIAAPVVSGAAALMLDRDPSLTPDTIKARMMITADKWKDELGRYDICAFGAGYLNIAKALRSTAIARHTALSPPLYRDDIGNVMIDMTNITWGNNVIWGLGGVRRLNVIWGEYMGPSIGILDTVIWGSHIFWGAAVWEDNIIWGSANELDGWMTAVYGED